MKNLLLAFILMLIVSPLSAKSYSDYLAEAKKYESQKQWCYALASYYDAMGANGNPEEKQEAFTEYKRLSSAIESGNPGIGKFNRLSLHNEWKNLLVDAENYGASFNPYEVTVGKLVLEKMNYSKGIASYDAEISVRLGDRYEKVIQIIETGYKMARESDWDDLPLEWPKYPAKYGKSGEVCETYNHETEEGGEDAFDRNEPLLYTCLFHGNFGHNVMEMNLYNAFSAPFNNFTAVVCEFNVVDEKGKELLPKKRYVLPKNSGKISFDDVSSDVVLLIDEGKAFLNPLACYLKFGDCYWANDPESIGRFSIGTSQSDIIELENEIPLSMEKSVFICWNRKTDRIAENVSLVENYTKLKRLEDLKVQRNKEDEKIMKAILALKYDSYDSQTVFYGDVSAKFDGSGYDNSSSVTDVIRMYAILNKASKKAGYSPCYYQEQNGKQVFDSDKWDLGKLEFRNFGTWTCEWEKAGSIKRDEKAKGFYGEYYSNTDCIRIFRNDSLQLKKKGKTFLKGMYDFVVN